MKQHNTFALCLPQRGAFFLRLPRRMIKFSASLAEINMLNKLRELCLLWRGGSGEKRFYGYERRKSKNNFLTVKLELTPEPDVDGPFDGAHKCEIN
jgi:hypothetical protein